MGARIFIFLALSFWALRIFAADLVISDVDDTLKLSDVPSYTGSADYAIDEYSHFLGMSELFRLIQKDNPSVSFQYVSRAPEWLLKTIHEDFLIRAGFPQGTYVGRTDYSKEEHKLLTIRALIEKHRPQRVAFFGDNGEADAEVYDQIQREYPKVQFSQYIHIVYTATDLWNEMVLLRPEQIGFVTSVELSVALKEKQWLSAESVAWMMGNILPRILRESPGGEQGALAFPYFMHCQDIVWRWDIPGLNEKMKQVCR